MNKEYLLISDDGPGFYTLEGEGEFIGQPSIFMRLFGCNLTCKGFSTKDAPFGCDSFISWSKKNKLTFVEIFDHYEKNKFISLLKNGTIFKITGGEPLVRQEPLLLFFKCFTERYGFVPRIDFETNATIIPDNRWVSEFNATFTTSPKLSNNGDPEKKTFNLEALKWHVKHNSGFKFVISSPKDIDEVMDKFINDSSGIKIPLNRIWLMPCCGSRQEHIEVAEKVAEYAKSLNVKFSPRLHLLIWDKALKV